MLCAVLVVVGRITAIDREARAIAVPAMTFTVPRGGFFEWLEIGMSVSILYTR